MSDTPTVQQYRKSATPGVPPSTASQRRLEQLRVCPLGRLVMQLDEIDNEIAEIKDTPKPSRMVIATLMGIKFNVLKSLLPYAYSTVPAALDNVSEGRVPVIINLDASEIMREEAELVDNINTALEEVRQEFPEYVPKGAPVNIGEGYRLV